MSISHVITGTRPNLTITSTDGYGTQVIVQYNTNDIVQNAYIAIREAFIDAYDSTISFECEYTGTGNIRTCQSTDSHANVITHQADITHSTENIRRETIGKFIDLYGMSDDNSLYQEIEDY